MNSASESEKNLLDRTNLKLLKLLQSDSQLSYRQLARFLKISPAAVHKRIQKLKKSGVISGFTVLIDPQKIGKKLKAFVGISTSAGSCSEVIAVLKERPEILEIHEIAGEHDLFAKIVTSDTDELNRVLHEIDRIPGVVSTRTLVVLKTEKETLSVPL